MERSILGCPIPGSTPWAPALFHQGAYPILREESLVGTILSQAMIPGCTGVLIEDVRLVATVIL